MDRPAYLWRLVQNHFNEQFSDQQFPSVSGGQDGGVHSCDHPSSISSRPSGLATPRDSEFGEHDLWFTSETCGLARPPTPTKTAGGSGRSGPGVAPSRSHGRRVRTRRAPRRCHGRRQQLAPRRGGLVLHRQSCGLGHRAPLRRRLSVASSSLGRRSGALMIFPPDLASV